MKQYIRINENDNVVVALVNLKKGFELSDGTILNEDIDLDDIDPTELPF